MTTETGPEPEPEEWDVDHHVRETWVSELAQVAPVTGLCNFANHVPPKQMHDVALVSGLILRAYQKVTRTFNAEAWNDSGCPIGQTLDLVVPWSLGSTTWRKDINAFLDLMVRYLRLDEDPCDATDDVVLYGDASTHLLRAFHTQYNGTEVFVLFVSCSLSEWMRAYPLSIERVAFERGEFGRGTFVSYGARMNEYARGVSRIDHTWLGPETRGVLLRRVEEYSDRGVTFLPIVDVQPPHKFWRPGATSSVVFRFANSDYDHADEYTDSQTRRAKKHKNKYNDESDDDDEVDDDNKSDDEEDKSKKSKSTSDDDAVRARTRALEDTATALNEAYDSLKESVSAMSATGLGLVGLSESLGKTTTALSKAFDTAKAAGVKVTKGMEGHDDGDNQA